MTQAFNLSSLANGASTSGQLAVAYGGTGVTTSTGSGSVVLGTAPTIATGTFIPQYQLSAAPGGAYTTQIGSYFKLSPMSASCSNTIIGTWS